MCTAMATISSGPLLTCLETFQSQLLKKKFGLIPTMTFNQGSPGNVYLTSGDGQDESTYGFVRSSVQAFVY